MGRFFDGVASLLGLSDKASYEGEAALYLETLASNATVISPHLSAQWSPGEEFSLNHFMGILVSEILRGTSREEIAYTVHTNLVRWIGRVATREKTEKIAFSGGVFQNGLLVDLIHKMLGDTHKLYFHKQLSPNDENIGFGQLAYNLVQQHQKVTAKQLTEERDLITI
jgi:hydrogenase maturation protein HypF